MGFVCNDMSLTCQGQTRSAICDQIEFVTGNAKSLKMRQAKRLIEQLLQQRWPAQEKLSQAAIAAWFGVNPSIVSNAVAESRPVGPQFVDGARKALGLKLEWFTEPRAADDEFWEWVADKSAVRPPIPGVAGIKHPTGIAALPLVTGVGTELGLDFEALGRLVTAMNIFDRFGVPYGRDEVITMVHVLGLSAPATGTREVSKPITRLKR